MNYDDYIEEEKDSMQKDQDMFLNLSFSHNGFGSPTNRDLNEESDEEDEQGENTELPTGWKKVPSRSRPGKFSFENEYTGERTAIKPEFPADKPGQGPFTVNVKVMDDVVQVNCGNAAQPIRWLIPVAIQQHNTALTPRGRLRQRDCKSGTSNHMYPNATMQLYRGKQPLEKSARIRDVLSSGETVVIQ